MTTKLVDSKGLAAMEKLGLAKMAMGLAQMAKDFDGYSNSSILSFTGEDQSDGVYLVELTVTVKAAST